MSTLFLKIASKVEAAMEAYNSVQGFANRAEWEKELKKEFVSAHVHVARSLYI